MSVEADVRIERVKAAFQQVPVAVLVTVVNAGLMAVVLAIDEPDPRVKDWLALSFAVGAARLATWWGHRRAAPGAAHIRRWSVASACGAFAAGLVWGGGSVLLFPPSEVYQLFWVFLIGGMCAGAAALHYAHLPSALAFIMPASLPLAVRFALEGSARRAVAGGMIAVFVVALAVTGRRSSKYFGETLRLRLDLAQSTDDLDATNARLRREIVERAAAEASLHHAQRMEALGQLAGGIAHDFNNVLQAVSSGLALIQGRAEDAEAVREVADTAADAVRRGAAITQRLLSFARKGALSAELVPVKPLLDGLHEMLRPTLGVDIAVRIESEPALPALLVDKAQLETILINLAVNGRDAMPHGGSLVVSARQEAIVDTDERPYGPREGNYVRFDMTDSGTGMDAATLARASEPFFTTKPPGQGTGLGLAMARGFAEQSGGGFAIQSQPGQGTRVTLWLPQAPETLENSFVGQTAPTEMPLSGVGKRVLVVDDDAMVRAVLVAQLEDAGYQVMQASDGVGALARLDANGVVNALVTDLFMPGMNGLLLIEEVRRRQPSLPAMLLTGYADVNIATDFEGLRDNRMVLMRKPISGDELVRMVAALVGPRADEMNEIRTIPISRGSGP